MHRNKDHAAAKFSMPQDKNNFLIHKKPKSRNCKGKKSLRISVKIKYKSFPLCEVIFQFILLWFNSIKELKVLNSFWLLLCICSSVTWAFYKTTWRLGLSGLYFFFFTVLLFHLVQKELYITVIIFGLEKSLKIWINHCSGINDDDSSCNRSEILITTSFRLRWQLLYFSFSQIFTTIPFVELTVL